MNKNSFKLYALFFFILSVITSHATQPNVHGVQINYQLLQPYAKSLASQIEDGYTITTDSIESHLDFIPYHCTNIKWEPKEFLSAFEKTQKTVEVAREKLGHNRFQTFVQDCKTLFNGELSLKDKYALFILLRSVQHHLDCLLEDIDGSVEDASRLPDEQLSFLFEYCTRSRSNSDQSAQSVTTEHGLTHESSSRESGGNKPPLKEDAEVAFSSIQLEGRSLGSSSFSSYTKQLSKINTNSPVCLTCDLKTIKKAQMDHLINAIEDIHQKTTLQEIIFTNGSSIKFNILFDFLKDFSGKRTPENPITIIYSTTSDSQKAYKKLSSLKGVIHATPEITGIDDADLESVQSNSIHDCQRFRSDFSDASLRSIQRILK